MPIFKAIRICPRYHRNKVLRSLWNTVFRIERVPVKGISWSITTTYQQLGGRPIVYLQLSTGTWQLQVQHTLNTISPCPSLRGSRAPFDQGCGRLVWSAAAGQIYNDMSRDGQLHIQLMRAKSLLSVTSQTWFMQERTHLTSRHRITENRTRSAAINRRSLAMLILCAASTEMARFDLINTSIIEMLWNMSTNGPLSPYSSKENLTFY